MKEDAKAKCFPSRTSVDHGNDFGARAISVRDPRRTEKLVSELQAEKLLHLPKGTLSCLRTRGQGVRSEKCKNRHFYRLGDIYDFDDARLRVQPGSLEISHKQEEESGGS